VAVIVRSFGDVPTTPPGLPDPTDHSVAWWNDEPAYYAWWCWLEGLDEEEQASSIVSYDLLARYSEAVPTRSAVDSLRDLGPLIEVGAGAGYWARLLMDIGADVIATDEVQPEANGWYEGMTAWTEIQQVDATDAVKRYSERTIFACWPPRGNGYMTRVLRQTSQRTLALITEGRPHIGSDPLYDELEGSWLLTEVVDLPHLPIPLRGLDSLMIWRR
jgi:hypothetical protein